MTKPKGKCKWKKESDWDVTYYNTSCGEDICFEEYNFEETGYKYCPFCGKLIEVRRVK